MATSTETEATEDRAAAIERELLSWPGVSAVWGSRGEYSFRVGKREIGHLHGDRVAHFAFPKRIWAELTEVGRIGPHPLDRPGLGARTLRGEDDVADAIALMRLNYERATGPTRPRTDES
jgi:hypothetical protein